MRRGFGTGLVAVGGIGFAPALVVTAITVFVLPTCYFAGCSGVTLENIGAAYAMPWIWIPAASGVALLSTGAVLIATSRGPTMKIVSVDF